MPEPAPLLDRVAASRLTPSGRRLARFYEDSLPGAALMNLQEVCEATGLSSATVVRFARALGYTGFKDMSQRLQAELRAGIDRPIDRLRRGRTPADGALVSRFARARADLDASLAALDPRAFETAADLLGDAGRPLYLGAVASGRPLLQHFALLASYLRGGVVVLAGTDRWAHALSGMPPRAVLLASAFDRTPAMVEAVLELAGARGATRVLITNRRASPLTTHADVVLVISHGSDGVFRSRTALLATLEALLDAMAERCPDTRRRAGDIEEAFSLFRGYTDA